MRVDLHKRFIKAYGKLPLKIRRRVSEKLAIFQYNPFEESLNNHALSGEYQGYRSINITGDYRAVFKNISEDAVLFVKIGKHAQLYD